MNNIHDIADNVVNKFSRRRNTNDIAAARRVVSKLDLETIHEMAAVFLTRAATAEARRRTLAAELNAEHRHREATRKYRNRTPEEKYKEEVEFYKNNPREKAEANKRESEMSDRFNKAFARAWEAFDGLKEQWRMEWTEELLNSTFTLRDGERISWGEATISQHQERVGIFKDNVIGNLKGVARHEQAIDELKKSGKRNLRQMVTESIL